MDGAAGRVRTSDFKISIPRVCAVEDFSLALSQLSYCGLGNPIIEHD